MASVRLLRRAEADLDLAVAWYQSRSALAARRFQAAVTAALDRIAAMPEMYPLVDKYHQLCPVRKSQYLIVYRFEPEANQIVVIAFACSATGPT